MKSASSTALLLANKKIAAASADNTRKWITRSMAISRRTYRSRSGRPRSGRLISSRGGGCSTVGLSGGLSASHESHRRHRYQRSPPSRGRTAYPPAAAPPRRSPAAHGRAARSRSAHTAAWEGTGEAALYRAPPAAPPDSPYSPARDYPATATGTASPPRLQTSAARPVFLAHARRLRSSPAYPARAAQSGPVFAQAPDPVRVPSQGGAAGQQPGGVPRHLRCALRLLRRRQYPQGLSGIRHGRWQPPDRRVQGRCPGTRGVSHGCGQEGQARGKVNKG